MSLKIAAAVVDALNKNSLTMAVAPALLRLPADGSPGTVVAMSQMQPPIAPPSLHRQLATLVEKGFVVRKQPGNIKTTTYGLSAAGKKLMAKLNSTGGAA